MKAVILSAGFGTRIKPLSDYTPKCLLPILGRPLIDNIILYLKQYGVKEIYINTHHLSDQIARYFNKKIKYGVKISLSHETRILGTGGGIGNLRNILKNEESFIVHNGDTLTNLDLQPALELHKKKDATLTLILRDYPPLNKFFLSSDGRILGFQSERRSSIGIPLLSFTGISIMSSRILKDLPRGKPSDLKGAFSKLIPRGELFGVLSFEGYWHEIGTLSDYLQVHQDLLWKRIPCLQSMKLPPKSIFVGRDSRVSKKADLRGFISIGKDCRVESGSQLEDCILMDGVTVKRRERALSTIFGKGWQVSHFSGGSDRKFYRVFEKGKSVVMMESKRDDPDFKRIIEIGKYLGKKLLGVPKIYRVERKKRLVVMEDLGDLTLQKVLAGKKEDKIFDLYCQVIEFLVQLQRRGSRGIPGTIPKFGYKEFRWETNYFKEEFLKRYCKMRITNEERLDSEFHTLANKFVKEPLYFMHRDFQSKNIYLKGGKVRITDYQSARRGPLAYDLVSLLKDCYFVLKEDLRIHLLLFYMDLLQIDGRIQLDEEEFKEVFLYAGLQRNMQALGAFAYLSLVKGKHDFEQYMPAGIAYLQNALKDTDEFPKLKGILEKIADRKRVFKRKKQ